MIRIAEERDVAEILSIYAPYVQNTTYSFEYDVPRLEAFLERFRTITTRFPWIVWEEEGKILGYAYGSEPFARAAYRWSCESSVYLRPEARGGASAGPCTPLWNRSWHFRAMSSITPSSLPRIPPPGLSTKSWATAPPENFPAAPSNSAKDLGSFGWKRKLKRVRFHQNFRTLGPWSVKMPKSFLIF